MNNNQEENIVFHDEEVIQEKKGPVSDKAKIAFFGSIAYLVMLIVQNFIYTESSGTISIILEIFALICFFGSIILGAISLKEIKKKALSGKLFAVLGIVLPIVFFVLIMVVGIIVNGDEMKEGFEQGFNCPTATQCVDNGDGTSTCQVNGEDFKCMNELLKPSQYE